MTKAEFIAWLKSPAAIRCVLVEAVARIAGVETTLYLASRPYVTAGTDVPAHTAYRPVVMGGVSFSESLSFDGQASISAGDIELENTDGSLDGWLGYVWANRPITVYMGDPRWARADFRKIFDGVVADVDATRRDGLLLRLLDKLQRLNRPISEAVLGGASVNKDKLVPVVFGEVFNMEPLLTNAATLEYQVHAGAVEDIVEVRDNGAPRSITKSLATGKFTLSAARVGQITASVQGDKPAVYVNTVAALVQRMATGWGPVNSRFSAGDLDAAQLSAFAATNTQPVGFVATARQNVLLACQQLAASVGAQVVMTSTGLLRLVQVALPAPGTPIVIGPEDYELGSLELQERVPVKAAVKLAYCRNWTPQSNGMATGLPDSSLENLRAEWLYATASDGTVAGMYRLDVQPVAHETHLLREADANAEAGRALALWSVPRHVWGVKGYSHLLLTELGEPATLSGPRYGLDGGVAGQVVRIRRDWTAGRVVIGVLA